MVARRLPIPEDENMIGKWQFQGDINFLEYGGLWYRQIGPRSFQFVEIINIPYSCGLDLNDEEDQADKQPTYVVELSMVNLNNLSEETIKSALDSCGPSGDVQITDEIRAFSCKQYGSCAPLGSWSGNGSKKLLREAKGEALRLARSASALRTKMRAPVNKIGQTALEFMTGDLAPALQRGCESGDPGARLMAKMHGVDQWAIDDARPADWLPFVCGYLEAKSGSPKASGKDISPEYYRGYERGVRVVKGECPAPSWIK
jgi:hypothetical protein